MERLQKALDKAGQQRVKNPAGLDVPQTKLKATASSAGAMAYTETKRVDTTEELLRNHRVIAGFENEPVADIYKILRTKVLQKMRALRVNTLAVTSPTQGGGKTLTAVNLAISIALDSNQSVLLVDFDLRRPSVHEYFGITPERGLSDYLLDHVPLSQLMINPGIERLVLLPGGKRLAHSSELLSTPHMIGLLDDMKKRYADRHIVYDLPPLLVTDDALVSLPCMDSVLLVIEDGIDTPEDVQASLQLLEHRELLGTVLNKSEDSSTAKYY